MICFADYHTHTYYSHGKGSVRDNVEAAARKGLEEIAISDHGPNHLSLFGIKDLTVLSRIREDLKAACAEFPQVKGLVSIEANIISTDGDLDLPPERAHLVDLVQAGLHASVRLASARDFGRIYGWHYLGKLWEPWSKRSRFYNTEAVVNAVYKNRIHIITHPGHRFNIDTRAVAKACRERGTAMEINCGHDHTTVEYLRIAAEEGVQFVIGSDAHSPERVGDFAKGIRLAKAAGLSPEQIINARAL
ncbi:MAG TPA: PHP domain-containing protein [Firmicutes bacterium]|jgi:putative hydrolase|nr:MAG: hypothetical protein AA931_06725 [Peptococcaceae bacterium 1109]HHT72347.1 PHP domain-containing protein [Bacillota bacterium]